MWVEVTDMWGPHVSLISLVTCFSSSPTGAAPTLHAAAVRGAGSPTSTPSVRGSQTSGEQPTFARASYLHPQELRRCAPISVHGAGSPASTPTVHGSRTSAHARALPAAGLPRRLTRTSMAGGSLGSVFPERPDGGASRRPTLARHRPVPDSVFPARPLSSHAHCSLHVIWVYSSFFDLEGQGEPRSRRNIPFLG
jgi:hypothetical protein